MILVGMELVKKMDDKDWKRTIDLVQSMLFLLLIVVLGFSFTYRLWFPEEQKPLVIEFKGIENVENMTFPPDSLPYIYIDCVKHCQENENSGDYQLRLCYEACRDLMEVIR